MLEREQLIHEIENTPDILVKEVLNFLLFIKSKKQLSTSQDSLSQDTQIPSFLTFIDELNAETSQELTTKLPEDFAQNLDYYLYGNPKQ
ncbi:hypothetical protein [Geminocystis sp. GBBB08]|uniref:hypothetical protein n=1 Tax=Geminocystis sp. GBBB08 TaxID=2604140 RepID=UPI0027E372D8|nr:hypothetical protein [Geminocystis sp. GBBB08]MBL1208712.1 hypothetical protein [Geminocystis sp. GBBB08]